MIHKSQSITVIGAGYVGIPTAAILAKFGNQVILAERDNNRLSMLQEGICPISEDGLSDLILECKNSGTLSFSSSATDAVVDADFTFLCVSTPRNQDGTADVSQVLSAVREISNYLKSGSVLIAKSTVPVGTSSQIVEILDRADISFVSNPEFLREGTALRDSFNPSRIVVGSSNSEAALRVAELFEPTDSPVLVTDSSTAELIKYVSNAFLATKLSFINSIAALVEVVGADIDDLILGVGLDIRIGSEYMKPGPGWGGSCLPKDTAALVSFARMVGSPLPLLEEAVAANNYQIELVIKKITKLIGSLDGAVIGVWGLTFKAGTNDLRDSPAIEIVSRIIAQGARVNAYDPTVQRSSMVDMGLSEITLCTNAIEAARGASVLLVLTEWDEFRSVNLNLLAAVMENQNIVDCRNILVSSVVRNNGFNYLGIGK